VPGTGTEPNPPDFDRPQLAIRLNYKGFKGGLSAYDRVAAMPKPEFTSFLSIKAFIEPAQNALIRPSMLVLTTFSPDGAFLLP
jgi:hypothetical protein